MKEYQAYLCGVYSEPELKKGTKLLFLYEQGGDFCIKLESIGKIHGFTLPLHRIDSIPNEADIEIEKQKTIKSGKDLSGVTKTIVTKYGGNPKDLTDCSAIILENESDIGCLVRDFNLKPVK